jgi:hypothetical protein
MHSSDQHQILHQEFKSISFDDFSDNEIVKQLSPIFLGYESVAGFSDALYRILSSSESANQAMTGYDDVKAELLSTTEGVASVIMQIQKSANNIGSASQNAGFRVVKASSPLKLRRYSIKGWTTAEDIQQNLSLELVSEEVLYEGDIGIIRSGPFANQFLFEPSGVTIHRLNQPSHSSFVHNFGSQSLAYLHSSFSGQEATRDHFFTMLAKNLSLYLAELHHEAKNNVQLQERLEAENDSIMGYFQKLVGDDSKNLASRWLAVQSLSQYKPEDALGCLDLLRRGGDPNVAQLASRSHLKLETYLRGGGA